MTKQSFITGILQELGQLSDLIQNVMKQTGATDLNEGIRRVNSGEWFLVKREPQKTPPRYFNLNKIAGLADSEGLVLFEDVKKCFEPKWVEEDGVIYLSLPPTTGRTGAEWLTHFDEKGYHIRSAAVRKALLSKDFVPTTGTIHRIAIFKMTGDNRTVRDIRNYAVTTFDKKKGKLHLVKPNLEVVCLIRDNFVDEELKSMGLESIAVMHEPIENCAEYQILLVVVKNGIGDDGGSNNSCLYRGGYAFELQSKKD